MFFYSILIPSWVHPPRFRQQQDNKDSGISLSSRTRRKKQNLVTMKFNMFNWLLETVSTLLVLFSVSEYFVLVYRVLNFHINTFGYLISSLSFTKCDSCPKIVKMGILME